MEKNRFDREGQQVGDYRLLKGLGKGGFGDVYLGEHIREHTSVAVKVLRSRLTRSEELKEFINEARTIRLKHTHIVPLLDFGIGSDDIPFLVMEYAPYGSLRDRHSKGSRLPLSTIVSYVTPIASALQYAHDQHLIHRDVKPENMLVGSQQEVLLTDFGIATVVHSSHSLISENGMGGTLPYMAPEQIQGKPRPASDQYALGIVVYEWICGTRPFNGTSIELLAMHQEAVPLSLREQVPTLTVEVEQVVLRALAKDPKQRFAHIQDFAKALEDAHLSVRNSSPIPTLDVPTVLPLLAEKTKQSVDRSDDETAFPLPPPVLNPHSLVTRPREKAFEHVTQGNISPLISVSKLAQSNSQREATPRRIHRIRFFPGRTVALIGLVLLVVAGSVGITFTAISRSFTAVGATATIHTQSTARVKDAFTATALTQATMTTSANASATTAVGNLTATVTSLDAFYIQATRGSLAFNNTLSDNTGDGHWDEGSVAANTGCMFTNNEYHVSEAKLGYFQPCIAENTTFSNFAYQIKITINKGNPGEAGILFRVDSDNKAYYFFRIGTDGSYALDVYDTNGNGSTLISGFSNAIAAGFGQANTLTVIAQDTHYSLFANGQYVDAATDSKLQKGKIGVGAVDAGTPIDVTFSIAQVWKL